MRVPIRSGGLRLVATHSFGKTEDLATETELTFPARRGVYVVAWHKPGERWCGEIPSLEIESTGRAIRVSERGSCATRPLALIIVDSLDSEVQQRSNPLVEPVHAN